MTSGNPARPGGVGIEFVEGFPNHAIYAFLALVSVLIYGQSVGFPLIWDSVSLIVENPATRTFDPIAAFTTPTTIGPEARIGDEIKAVYYYRPLLRLFFSAWYQVAGENSALWHGLAVVVNIVAVFLVFRLMLAMKQPRWVALAVALLFAVNPGRVSGVTWVYSLSNQVFGVLILAAFLCWVREARLWSLGIFVAALGCRETTILFPVIALFWEFLFKRRREAWAWLGVQCGLVAGYLVVRSLVVGGVGLTALSPLVWLNTVAVILSSHLQSLIWPSWGVRFYPFEDYSAFSTRVLISYGVLAAGLAALVWALRRNAWVAFWLLWFYVWISIHFNAGHFGEFLMGEKNNYLLAVSVAVLLVSLAQLARRHALVLCAIAIVAHGGLSAWRVTHWRDPVTYFNSAIENAPEFATLHYNLGLAYVEAQDVEKATASYLRAIDLKPGYSMAWNNLGVLRYMGQDLAGAAEAWHKAFDANPSNIVAAGNLSLVYSRLGDKATAAKYYSIYLALLRERAARLL